MTKPLALDDAWATIGETARRLKDSSGTPGLAIGLAAGGETRFLSLGTTAEHGTNSVTENTRFRWCSITKVVVAEAARAEFAERGIDLDSEARTVLPSIGGSVFDGVTIRMLLNHSSGLEGEWPESLAVFGHDDQSLSRFVAASGGLKRFADPGSAFGYCNPGWWILAAILEQLTGSSAEQTVRARIISPLGLSRTSSEDQGEFGIGPDDAQPHLFGFGAGAPPLPARMPRARFASGGLAGSAADAVTFARSVLLRPADLTQAITGAIPADRDSRRQGLGWAIDVREHGESPGHSGYFGGFTSQLQLFPEQKAAFVMLGNSDTSWYIREGLTETVLDLFAGAPTPRRSAPDTNLSSFAGRFEFPEAVELELTPSGEALGFSLSSGETNHSGIARRVSADTFTLDDGSDPNLLLRLLDGGQNHPQAVRLGAILGGRKVEGR